MKRAPQDPVLSAKESVWPQRERSRDRRQRQDTEEQGEREESKGERRKEGKREGEELFVLGGQRTVSGWRGLMWHMSQMVIYKGKGGNSMLG